MTSDRLWDGVGVNRWGVREARPSLDAAKNPYPEVLWISNGWVDSEPNTTGALAVPGALDDRRCDARTVDGELDDDRKRAA